MGLTGMILKMRYCIVEELGSGGEGHLYLARDMELGNYWAVKELPISKKREAKLLRLLEHPYIPRMVDYVESGECCYLVMEYIRGKSLGQMLRDGYVFSADELLAYTDTILQVLEYLHSQKPPVYYGDLKPDNLMLADFGKLYLVDFGSAVLGLGNVQRICLGTEGFAAPEQYEGRMGSASDLYALGKTLQCLIGKNWFGILWKMPGFFRLLSHLIHPNEKRRFQSAGEARKMLLNMGKRKGQTRKNMAIILGTAGMLGAAGMLFAYQERKPSFEMALTKVTECYYESDPEIYSGNDQEDQRTDKQEYEEKRKVLYKEAEEGLVQLLKEYPQEETQRKLLLMLAANAELQEEWERAAVYYEQLLLYAPEFGEGYGKYGLFLLRRGQDISGRRLWRLYEKRVAGGDESVSVVLWRQKLEAKDVRNG